MEKSPTTLEKSGNLREKTKISIAAQISKGI